MQTAIPTAKTGRTPAETAIAGDATAETPAETLAIAVNAATTAEETAPAETAGREVRALLPHLAERS